MFNGEGDPYLVSKKPDMCLTLGRVEGADRAVSDPGVSVVLSDGSLPMGVVIKTECLSGRIYVPIDDNAPRKNNPSKPFCFKVLHSCH